MEMDYDEVQYNGEVSCITCMYVCTSIRFSAQSPVMSKEVLPSYDFSI